METISQTFDFTRFVNCFKRELILGGRRLVLKWLVLVAAMAIMLYVGTKPDQIRHPAYYNNQQVSQTYIQFGFVCVFALIGGASFFMQNMVSNGTRLNSLMSPASTLEKYVSRMLLCVVGVTLGFIAAYYVAEGICVMLIQFNYPDVQGLRFVGLTDLYYNDKEFMLFLLWVFAGQATFVLGSTVAPKNAFLKTAVALVVLGLLFSFVISNVYALALHPDCGKPTQFAREMVSRLAKIFPIVWMIFCYITAYFRLKESEIIDRL